MPFDERVRAVMRVINDHADRTGKKVMYAFNLTGELDQMRRRHDLVLELGGTCIMASLNSVGLVGMIELGRFSQLPIHAHRNGWGYLSRSPDAGLVLCRLAEDLAPGRRRPHACEWSAEQILGVGRERHHLGPGLPHADVRGQACITMPVFSSGQSAKQAPGTYAGLGSADLIVTAGGGIMAHPDGPAAGVSGLREAWEATIGRRPARRLRPEHPALAKALEARAA